jgi:hypothetical protein
LVLRKIFDSPDGSAWNSGRLSMITW